MRKSLILLILPLFLCSCATINFSSKYYTLPSNYENDIDEIFRIIKTYTPLKNRSSYSYKISKDNETLFSGTPQIKDFCVYLPEYFIKYVYEFYYPKYHKEIFASIILHELAHYEGNFKSAPPSVHYKCDKYAITNLTSPLVSTDDFYSTIVIFRDYWSAQKSAIGKIFKFDDLFYRDVKIRLSLMKKDYPTVHFIYQRTK